MVAESIYKNYGKAVKEKGIISLTLLSSDAIEMIAGLDENQINEIYTGFGIRFLRNEVRAWEKLEQHHISSILEKMIAERY